MLAETNITGILLVSLGALAIALSIVAFALRNRARGRKAQVPGALRPGPADAPLETPLLNRLQGWGVVLMTFFQSRVWASAARPRRIVRLLPATAADLLGPPSDQRRRSLV